MEQTPVQSGEAVTIHTPGPWKLENLNGHMLGVRVEGPIVSGYVAFIDTDWPFQDQRDQQAANVRLIAAAPELLAALIAVVAVADRKTDVFDAAHAAIRKATGGTL